MGAVDNPALGFALEGNRLKQGALAARAQSQALGLDLGWDKAAQDLYKGGHQAYGNRMGSYADFEAASAAWDAKAQYSNLSGLFGVYGGNPGSLHPGPKPSDLMGFAMSGSLGSDARAAARYPGSGYFWTVSDAMAKGRKTAGSNLLSTFDAQSFGYDYGRASVAPLSALPGVPAMLGDAYRGGKEASSALVSGNNEHVESVLRKLEESADEQ
jgi:hypothetical protein